MLIIEDHSEEKQRIDMLIAENEALHLKLKDQTERIEKLMSDLIKARHDSNRYARRIRFEQKRVDAVVNENRRLIKDSNILSEVRTLFWRMFDDGK